MGWINGSDTSLAIGDRVSFNNIDQPMTVTKVTTHLFDYTEIDSVYQLPDGTMNILSNCYAATLRKLNGN